MDGEGQYVGDEAAQWFSNYLNKPGCKMYQLSQPRVISEDEKWGDVGRPDDKVHDNDDNDAAENCYLKLTVFIQLL